MSFGLLKHLKDSKHGTAKLATSVHYGHLILGQDLGSVFKLLELRKSDSADQIKLISTRPFNRQVLIENYEFGISQLRSPLAIENIYKKFHEAKIRPIKGEASFYKDGKFHDFSGRAKPMELQKSEDFFINTGYRFELSSFFSPEDWENLDSIINEHLEIRIFESIEKTEPNELVEKKEWFLTFKDFSRITTENLYVSMSPKKFLNLLEHKEAATKELIDVCSSVHVQAGISLTWKLDKEIYSEEKTLFIPQSMTHEWGHFLVEFESYDYQKNEQTCHALFLIHEIEPQAEDLATKIKLLKRVLDRVFPDLEQHIIKEYIRFDEEMFISDIKDSSLEQINFDYPTLKFLGQMSPMSGNLNQEKFLSRVLLN